MVEFREATRTDAVYVGSHLRAADAREALAATGGSPFSAVLLSWLQSDVALCLRDDVAPLCLFGVAPVGPGVGAPWMVGTDRLPRYATTIAREGPKVIDRFHSLYATLVNRVYARNIVHIRWLERMGFEIEPPERYGPERLLFHTFRRESPCAPR